MVRGPCLVPHKGLVTTLLALMLSSAAAGTNTHSLRNRSPDGVWPEPSGMHSVQPERHGRDVPIGSRPGNLSTFLLCTRPSPLFDLDCVFPCILRAENYSVWMHSLLTQHDRPVSALLAMTPTLETHFRSLSFASSSRTYDEHSGHPMHAHKHATVGRLRTRVRWD
jgi:hypothetical protein